MSPSVLETPVVINDTVQELVTEVLQQGNFDATEAQALKWLTRRQRTMCARSRVYRKMWEYKTVAEQFFYAISSEISEIRELQVESLASAGNPFVPYGTGRHSDIAQGNLHYLWLSGLYLAVGGGIMTHDYNEAGTSGVAIYPTPTESGLGIRIYGVALPPDLVIGENSTLKIPAQYLDDLVHGAIATGLQRLEGRFDLAAQHQQAFDAGCEELLQWSNKRFRGTSGAAQMRVEGFNA